MLSGHGMFHEMPTFFFCIKFCTVKETCFKSMLSKKLKILFCFSIACKMVCAQIDTVIAHSHNDYLHEHPLFDALNCNFRSIEADVYSIGDSLFVAHDFDKIKSGHTLRSLYLEPLKEQIQKNHGSVYGDGEEIILFIDIKDNGDRTYNLFHDIIAEYKEYMTVFENGVKTKGQIMVVISGNRPYQFMKEQVVRYAGYDGRLDNLDSNIPSSLMPVISDNWDNYFTWNGTGEMPRDEKLKLHEIATKAKYKGYLLRFWATPNQSKEQRTAVWTVLTNAGVGMIGTDNLIDLKEFIQHAK